MTRLSRRPIERSDWLPLVAGLLMTMADQGARASRVPYWVEITGGLAGGVGAVVAVYGLYRIGQWASGRS